MLTLYYSPHSTSVDNEARRASGHADVPLSAVGREQARVLGIHYAATAIAAVYSSDLQRATATARIAFEARGLPIRPDARLRECDYGDLTQHPTPEIDAAFLRNITTPFPNGESVQMVTDRVGAFLRDALRDHDGQTIVVIGHRATRYALQYWTGSEPLDTIVRAEWPWLDIPIWRYEVDAKGLDRPGSPNA